MSALAEMENLSKAYGRNRVLSGLSMSVQAQRNLLLTGPSGCGKSTLLRLIAGLETLDEGTIRIEGSLVSERGRIVRAPHKRGLAMVFQDLGLWPNLTAFQNVMLGLARVRLSRREKSERVRAILKACDMTSKADARPPQLSVGEQQRVALARAMAVRPKLLLLDEPSLVLVSHNPFDANSISADVAVLEAGTIRESGSLEQLHNRPRSQTLQAWKNETQPPHV
ncbi:MAG: hypothetical protein DME22_06645 [Verrucomicrobia bacterium]|nr:MAG: hypothetical protein DME22_06645 [Verrucomicrobiota bacterium]